MPEIAYARSGDVHIAYEVSGDGPFDLVYVPGFVSHLEMDRSLGDLSTLFDHLGRFARLIRFDKRGTGMSDRGGDIPTLEERMDDVRAVMDAAGSERAALFGVSEGGPLSVLFAASYPERTRALVLYGTTPRFVRAADFPYGAPEHAIDRAQSMWEETWGTGAGLEIFMPSYAADDRRREEWARYQRTAASPGAMAAIVGLLKDIDVRHVLPSIRVPTLVLHRTGDRAVSVEAGRAMAEGIPGARYLELEGNDHAPFVHPEQIVGSAVEFLTGSREPVELDRVLATVLFTDIVGSTQRAAAVGDRSWVGLLERHDAAIRTELDRFRGREVKNTGDGFLATFDGPARAVRCACAIREAAQRVGIEVRAGLHTGEVELREGDIGGIAVHIGSRVASLAQPGEVLVSRTVTDLVAGSGLSFADRGEHELKGVPGQWSLYRVEA